MKNITVDHINANIIVSSAFMKKIENPSSAEYAQLQAVRRDYPEFVLTVRQFKKNTKQERYRGLTYAYMREYIKAHESKENVEAVLVVFDEKINTSKGHSTSRRYPVIKEWFLKRYPEFTEFGMTEEELEKWRNKQESADSRENVTEFSSPEDLPATGTEG